MYGLGGLEQVEVVKRRRRAKWLEKEKEKKEKTKDRSVPDGSDNNCLYYSDEQEKELEIKLDITKKSRKEQLL